MPIARYKRFSLGPTLLIACSFAAASPPEGTWLLDSEATAQYLLTYPTERLKKLSGWSIGSTCGLLITFDRDGAVIGPRGEPDLLRLSMQSGSTTDLAYVGGDSNKPPRVMRMLVKPLGSLLLIDFQQSEEWLPFLWRKSAVPAASLRMKDLSLEDCLAPFKPVDELMRRKSLQ